LPYFEAISKIGSLMINKGNRGPVTYQIMKMYQLQCVKSRNSFKMASK